jgi:hypothetical protein
MIYKFKVTFEDQEDIYREIEIRSTQTFEELHNAIQQAVGFDNSKDASFFISDDYWRKGEEISLKSSAGKKQMAKSKIAGFIEDPHQKILYYFDPEAGWSFYVELLKIVEEDPKLKYPKCTRTVGTSPKQYKETNLPPVVEEEEEEADAKVKEKIFTTEEGYDTPEEDEDVIIEGEEETAAEEGEEPAGLEDSTPVEED